MGKESDRYANTKYYLSYLKLGVPLRGFAYLRTQSQGFLPLWLRLIRVMLYKIHECKFRMSAGQLASLMIGHQVCHTLSPRD